MLDFASAGILSGESLHQRLPVPGLAIVVILLADAGPVALVCSTGNLSRPGMRTCSLAIQLAEMVSCSFAMHIPQHASSCADPYSGTQ